MNSCKIVLLLILLSLASFGYAGTTSTSDTEDGITITATVCQYTGENGPVGDSENGITIAAEIFPTTNRVTEVSNPASYNLEATASDTTPSTGQPVNFSMLFSETPELTNTNIPRVVGEVEV